MRYRGKAVGMKSRLLIVGVGLSAAFGVIASVSATPSREVELAEGRVGNFDWSVRASRLTGPAGLGTKGRRRPCLAVAAGRSIGQSYRVREVELCSRVPGYLAAKEPPLVVQAREPSSGGRTATTIIAMAFAPAVRSVEIAVASGYGQTWRPRRLNARQGRKARLVRFRYIAVARRGWWCADQLITYGQGGNELWNSGGGMCPDEVGGTFSR